MAPKRLQAYGRFSDELLIQSSISVDNFVRMALARALALEWDRVAIEGLTASGEPNGIINRRRDDRRGPIESFQGRLQLIS